jgi:hypothetical protein
MNELEEDLDGGDGDNEKPEMSNNEDNSDIENHNVNCLMNVFAF